MSEDTEKDNKSIAKILKLLFLVSILSFKPAVFLFFLVLWIGFIVTSDFFEAKTAKLFVIGLIIFAYFIFLIPDNKMTPEEMKEAIRQCKRHEGRVIYDNNGEYYDCDLNGRLGDDI